MADEVNTEAFQGGDTAPGTKEKIAERNQAMQDYVDKNKEISEKLAEAQQEAQDAAIEAEKAVAESTQALVTGAPVPPAEGAGAETAADTTAAAPKSSKSS